MYHAEMPIKRCVKIFILKNIDIYNNMKFIHIIVNWNDDKIRLVARVMLAILLLLLASFTPFFVLGEGQQYIMHSHDENSHHHHTTPQPGDDALASTPVTLKEPVILLAGDGYLLAPPQNPVLSLDHPPG